MPDEQGLQLPHEVEELSAAALPDRVGDGQKDARFVEVGSHGHRPSGRRRRRLPCLTGGMERAGTTRAGRGGATCFVGRGDGRGLRLLTGLTRAMAPWVLRAGLAARRARVTGALGLRALRWPGLFTRAADAACRFREGRSTAARPPEPPRPSSVLSSASPCLDFGPRALTRTLRIVLGPTSRLKIVSTPLAALQIFFCQKTRNQSCDLNLLLFILYIDPVSRANLAPRVEFRLSKSRRLDGHCRFFFAWADPRWQTSPLRSRVSG